MKKTTTLDRRSFLKISAIAGGGIAVGITWLASCKRSDGASSDAKEFVEMNAFVEIAADGTVTLFAPNPEIGQGVKTSMPMLVAEELDVDWQKVIVKQAPLNTDAYTRQVAGGSGSIREAWEPMRKAGAAARQLLIAAAAARWGIETSSCTTDNGMVLAENGKKKLSYGELAADAAQMESPAEVTLKDPANFRIIGKALPNVDNRKIVTGQPLFGIDTRREGMYFAMVVRPPAFGKKLQSLDDAATKAMPGIKDVVSFDDKVAVVGASTWAVKKGRDALRIIWEDGSPLESTAGHQEQFRSLIAKAPEEPKRKDGDVVQGFKGAKTVVEGTFEAPFLPHAPLEPMNFFAHVREDGIELHGPIQTPARARTVIAEKLGVAEETVTVGMSRMGGGFGRRLYHDFVIDAAMVSKLAGVPVQVMWTREDDMQGGIYRPTGMYSYRAALNEAGELVAWHCRAAAVNTDNGTLPNNFPAGSVPNFQVDFHRLNSNVTTGAWRAPNHNFVAFAEESMIDDIAHAAQKDPLQFRLELLDKAAQAPAEQVAYDVARYRRVLQLAAEKAGWGQPKPEGIFQGLAAHYSFRTYVAQVADVSIVNGQIKVHKVYCAVDCGIVVNPSGAETQIAGGIIDGLGHALFGELLINNGAPSHRNFDTYRLIRMPEAPDVEVFFVESEESPTGLGEPGLPPIAAAVGNAVFAATGQRLRKQPFVQSRLLG
jgi:isoquinoline 1-oxidoreductase subunit beta